MKTLVLSALISLTASIAQAAPLYCTTNVERNPMKGSTDVAISSNRGATTVSQTTQGGMAHYITAPKKFAVEVTHQGPELVIYTNSAEGFELTVSFQPIGGEIRGTLITEVFGQRIDVPVVCSSAE